MFATKPQLAGTLLDRAHGLGIRAAFVAGDEVYGGRELRRGIRLAPDEEDHQLAKQSTGLHAGQVVRWKSWHRWTAICLERLRRDNTMITTNYSCRT